MYHSYPKHPYRHSGTAMHKVKTAQVYPQSIINEVEVCLFEELKEETVEFAMLKSMFRILGKRRHRKVIFQILRCDSFYRVL